MSVLCSSLVGIYSVFNRGDQEQDALHTSNDIDTPSTTILEGFVGPVVAFS